MLKDSGDYYKKKAMIWIESDSCPDYMQRADDCLKRERETVSHYLHSNTEETAR
ncbi:cullin-1-like protein, partial [Trifolium pratense]